MKSNLACLDVQNKTVLLRFDGNVPIDRGTVLNDQRLLATLPTIHLLLEKGATVILLTHIGRPEHKDLNLSTRQLLSCFDDYGLHVTFAQNPSDVAQKKAEGHRLILMENLRFFPGEKGQEAAFARELASLGDFYVNDAFGSLARKDASIKLLPDYFDNAHKTIGLLVEHELVMLDAIKKKMRKPYVLIIGGNKASDKIPLIGQAMHNLSTVLVGPALVFSFLKAQGKPVGNSLVDNEALNMCKEILMHAEEANVKIEYPLDYIIAEGTFDGPLDISSHETIANGQVGVSIGPKTAAAWSKIISHANSVVMNGLMGALSRPESLMYTKDLLHAMAHTSGCSVIAGGDSVAAAYYFDVAKDIDYLSTGGSAALNYLNDIPLAGLDALKIQDKSPAS